MIRATLLGVLVFLLAASLPAAESNFEIHYPTSGEQGKLPVDVYYYLWIPPGVEKLRGVIVHQHGCGTGAEQGGITAAQDLHWQALARKWDCALLGSSYRAGDGGNCRHWCDPRNGSSETFLQALSDFAEKSQHPELKEVPWCLWGHSGGGFWASLMQVKYPERIVAIWFRSGTAFPTWQKGDIAKPEIPAAAYQVPAMGNPGFKEKTEPRFKGAWDGLVAMHSAYRAEGAPFGLAPDPRTGHECGDSRYLAIPFFDACLEMRLPEKGSSGQKLRPIDQKIAWLAAPDADTAQPAADYPGDPKGAIWLPNEAFAQKWQEYVKTGATSDTTPPPAPRELQAQRKDDGVELTWSAAADFESGLQAFVIEREGEVVGQVPEKPVGRFGRPLFQTMSYHDTPERPLAEMKFLDKGAKEGAHRYRVRAVNSAGLKSELSGEAMVKGK